MTRLGLKGEFLSATSFSHLFLSILAIPPVYRTQLCAMKHHPQLCGLTQCVMQLTWMLWLQVSLRKITVLSDMHSCHVFQVGRKGIEWQVSIYSSPPPRHREHTSSPRASQHSPGTSIIPGELARHANYQAQPRPTGSEILEVAPRNLCFNKSYRWLWWCLMLENYCSRLHLHIVRVHTGKPSRFQ